MTQGILDETPRFDDPGGSSQGKNYQTTRVMQAPDQVLRIPEQCERPIVLLGASVRAAAQSARTAGWDVLGIDLFGDPETREACKSFRLVDEILATDDLSLTQWTRQGMEPGKGMEPGTRQPTDQRKRHRLPLMIVGGLLKTQEVVDRLQGQTRLMGASPELFQQASDPAFLATLARVVGMRFPDSHLAGRSLPEDAPPQATWLSKTIGSSGGLGVRWASATSTSSGDDLYRQRWISGRAFGVSFICDGEAANWLGVCKSLYTSQNKSSHKSLNRRRGRRPFVYAGSFGPVALSQEQRSDVQRVGSEFVSRTQYRGLLNADVIVDHEARAWLLEINPRWSGSSEIIERSLRNCGAMAASDSLMGWTLEATDGDSRVISTNGRIETCDRPSSKFLKRVIYAHRDGQFASGGLAELATEIDVQAVLTDLPLDGQRVRAGDPLLSVIVEMGKEQPISWRQLKRLFAYLQRAVVINDQVGSD